MIPKLHKKSPKTTYCFKVKGSDYEPDKIEFKIVRKPIFGELIYYESGLPVPVTFTYDELINKNIMYVIFPEKDATNDSFVFDVQDANGKFTQARRSVDIIYQLKK